MAKTRSKGVAGTAAATDKKSSTVTAAKASSSSTYTLPPESDNPPKLFILPKTATPSARIITLQHPRYNKPTRYLVCPEAGFFEFTQIPPPPAIKTAPRSWLINSNNATTSAAAAQIIQSPALYLTTLLDPLFLLLPALLCTPPGSPSSSDSPKQKPKRMFLSLDDHLDALTDPSKHLAETLATWPATRNLLEARLAAVCDVVQAGDEDMYRLSETKLLAEVFCKASGMVAQGVEGHGNGGGAGLPWSMEEKFVKRELEAPVVGVRVTRGGGVAMAGEEGESASASGRGTLLSGGEESAESQASVSSTETAVSSTSAEVSVASTAATSVVDEEGAGHAVASPLMATEEVLRLQRLRVAFNFICSRYVAPPIAEMLKERLAVTTGLADFKPLNEYLGQLAKLRQEAAAARSTDFSRKRAADEEEDERAEKRRKKEAEEKSKKANMSRGVKELMKVNTSGMKKLSDFFKKKP